jgi:hypothetical protein
MFCKRADANEFIRFGKRAQIIKFVYKVLFMKRNRFLTLIIVMLLIVTMAMLAACNNAPDITDPDDQTTEPTPYTEGLLITNADFKVTTGDTYPYKPATWTGSSPSTTAYPNDVIAGVIDVVSEAYDSNKYKWNNLQNPGKKAGSADDRMLMIYMPTAETDIEGVDEAAKGIEYGATAYGFTSGSFTMKKGYYYKLTVDVKTQDIAGNEGKAGARIYVSSTAYAEFRGIDTDGEWQTYEIYIEASKGEDKTLTLNLGLGYYSSTTPTEYLTTGYAFFDNISLTKIVEDGGVSPKEQFEQVADTDDDRTAKVTYTVPNGEFEFGSAAASSSSAAPSLWSISTGGSATDDAAPTAYRYNGIVDTEAVAFAANKTKLGTTVYKVSPDNKVVGASSVADLPNPGTPANALGTKVYMLSQIYMTAQYISTSTPIVIEKGKYYELSIPVYTTGIYGEGVSITLTGNGDDISFFGISKSVYDDEEDEIGNAGTTNGWTVYTFAIKGNTFRDLSFTLQLWLGTGDKSKNTEKTVTRYTGAADDYTTTTKKTDHTTYTSDGSFAKGWAFFDSIKLTETDSAGYAAFAGAPLIDNSTEDTKVDGELKQALRLDLDSANYFFGSFDGSFNDSADDPAISYDNNTFGTPNGFSTTFDDGSGNSKINGVSIGSTTRAGVVDTSDDTYFEDLGIDNPGTPYDIGTTKVLMLHNPISQLYRIDSAEFEIVQNTSYRIAIWVKTQGIKGTSGAYLYVLDEDGNELAVSEAVNTKDYENEFTNDWLEYTFIVRGYSDKNANASLRLAIGSGDKWSSSTLTEGTAFFANVNCVEITQTEYTKLSSASKNTKSKSLTTEESGKLIYNAAFNLFDLEKTKGLVNGELSGELGVPTKWTISSSADTGVKSGIAKFDTDDDTIFTIQKNSQLDLLDYDGALNADGALGDEDWSIYDNWPSDSADPLDNLNGGPCALIIDGTPGAGSYAVGYRSQSITLSKVTNYKISVWVRTVGQTTYSIYLTGENGSVTYFNQENFISVTTNENVWTKHTFYVEVGLVDTTVTLSLWLGTNAEITDEVKSKGIVIFDSISYSSTLTSEEFDAVTQSDNDRKISFLSDGFDTEGNELSAKTSLATPQGWTGELASGGASTKSSKGVIYVKDLGSFIDIDSVFGKSYPSDFDEMEDGDPEKESIRAEILATKIPPAELTPMANGGNRFLIINNKEANGYSYTSTAYTLSPETYFRISIWVKTYNVEEGKGAFIEIDAGENDQEFLNINTGVWTEYVFFIKTSDVSVSDVKIKIGLGREGENEDEAGFVTGYAMFDNVTFGILTQTEFEAIDTESELFTSGRAHIIEMPESPANVGGDDNTPTEPFKPNLTYLWWMIPSLCIGVALIAVMIAVFVKKVYKPRKQQELEASYSKEAKSSESLEVKKSEYDKFKE